MTFTEADRRWMELTLVLHKVVVPTLRTFVETIMKELYGVANKKHGIAKQSGNNCVKKWSKYTLVYKNINNNDREKFANYNYEVCSHVDFSKLFLKDYMAKFTSFSDTDASALLGLIVNVDDSSCSKPRFQQTRQDALNVRRIRNECAHYNSSHWDEKYLKDSYPHIDALINEIASPSDLAALQTEIEQIKGKGETLISEM